MAVTLSRWQQADPQMLMLCMETQSDTTLPSTVTRAVSKARYNGQPYYGYGKEHADSKSAAGHTDSAQSCPWQSGIPVCVVPHQQQEAEDDGQAHEAQVLAPGSALQRVANGGCMQSVMPWITTVPGAHTVFVRTGG